MARSRFSVVRRAEATRSSASLPLHARRSHRVPELISNPVISGKMPSPFYVCRRRADAENFMTTKLSHAARTKGSARQCRLHHSSRLQERETGEFIADLQVGAGLARELNRRLGCSVNKFQCRSRSGKRCRRPSLNELRHTQRCPSRLLGPPLRHRGWDNICKKGAMVKATAPPKSVNEINEKQKRK